MKLGPMGYLFMKKKKKFKTRIYIIILKFPPPKISDGHMVEVDAV